MKKIIKLTIATVFATMLNISVQAQTKRDSLNRNSPNQKNNRMQQDTLHKRNDNKHKTDSIGRPVKPGSKNYDQKIYKDSINRSKTTPKNGSLK